MRIKLIVLAPIFACIITTFDIRATIFNSPESITEAAQTLLKNELFDDASTLLQQGCSLFPNDPNLQFLYGYVLLCQGKLESGLQLYATIGEKWPSHKAIATYNIGYISKIMGDFTTAISIFSSLIQEHPNYEPARLGLAFAYMQTGQFKKAWEAHQWNLIEQKKDSPALREYLARKELYGKTILTVPEGGLGDTIMCIRACKPLKELGARVIAAIQPPLIPLLGRCKYIDQVIPSNNINGIKYDARVTYMSLPTILNLDEANFSPEIPYIYPDPYLNKIWGKVINQNPTTFKIGICWQADVVNDSRRLPIARRGIPLTLLASLAEIPNVQLYSLQKHVGVDQLEQIHPNTSIITFNESFDVEHGCFTDTAAVMMHLDLIISIDSAIAHLAGALGKPVFLLLPYNPDWRWITGRTDSPWYPTMRIFKQPYPFDWDSVMKELIPHVKQMKEKNK